MLTNTQTIDAAPASARSGGMLPKLLKYEFRATARLYLPLYLVVLVFGLLGRFSLFGTRWNVSSGSNKYGGWYLSANPELSGFFGEVLSAVISFVLVGYVMVVLGAFVVHFIITLQRFWKNLMGDEGYLMFTLPVSTDALLWSKAICAFAWSIATGVVVLFSVFLLCGHPAVFRAIAQFLERNLSDASWWRIWTFLSHAFPFSFWVKWLSLFLVDGFSKLFLLYAAMAIGHTVKKHKILAAVGGYIAINMVEGTIASTLTATVMPFLSRSMDGLPEDFLFYTREEMALFADALGQVMGGTLLLALALSAVFGAATYLLARYLLNTQLNLE